MCKSLPSQISLKIFLNSVVIFVKKKSQKKTLSAD